MITHTERVNRAAQYACGLYKDRTDPCGTPYISIASCVADSLPTENLAIVALLQFEPERALSGSDSLGLTAEAKAALGQLVELKNSDDILVDCARRISRNSIVRAVSIATNRYIVNVNKQSQTLAVEKASAYLQRCKETLSALEGITYKDGNIPVIVGDIFSSPPPTDDGRTVILLPISLMTYIGCLYHSGFWSSYLHSDEVAKLAVKQYPTIKQKMKEFFFPKRQDDLVSEAGFFEHKLSENFVVVVAACKERHREVPLHYDKIRPGQKGTINPEIVQLFRRIQQSYPDATVRFPLYLFEPSGAFCDDNWWARWKELLHSTFVVQGSAVQFWKAP